MILCQASAAGPAGLQKMPRRRIEIGEHCFCDPDQLAGTA